MLDQVRVDDGVKEVVIDGVVDVCVLVVVAPCVRAGLDGEVERREGGGRTSVCGRRG